MDNFSAHRAAFEFLNSSPLTSLKNTSVIFLPPNVTSLHQPLDQGIIHAWKCHYRKKWLNYMIETHEKGDDPLKEMDVLKAMRWGFVSWHFDVTQSSIQKCWNKSGLLSTKSLNLENISANNCVQVLFMAQLCLLSQKHL